MANGGNAQPQTVPWLPKLRKDPKFALPVAPGVWDPREQHILADIAAGIAVPRPDATLQNVDSIPTVWAQPVFFAMALFNEQHPLHGRVRGEWRGLLAMLALKRWLGLSNLSVLPIDSEPTCDFAKAAYPLKPTAVIDTNTKWDHLYIIRYERPGSTRPSAIGLAVPRTLVATARNYIDRIDNRIRWYNGTFLEDPIASFNDGMKRAVAGWLGNLRKTLQESRTYDKNEGDPLVNQLNQFIVDLGFPIAAPPSFIRGGGSIGFDPGLIYGAMDMPAINGGSDDDKPPVQAHTSLVMTRECAENRPIYLVSPKIAKDWKCDENDVLVYGTVSLRDALSSPSVNSSADRKTLCGHPLFGGEWRIDSDLFTERLTVFARAGAFPLSCSIDGMNRLADPNGRPVTPLVPLKNEVLDWYPAEELAGRVKFTTQGTSIIRVQVRITLSGRNGDGSDFFAERAYRLNDQVDIVESELPAIEMWPNFRLPDDSWRVYYCFAGKMADDEVSFAPWVYGAAPERPYEEANWSITKYDQSPEAIACNVEHDHRRIEAGTVLLKPPETVRRTGATWTIGVDFGSTATNVYVFVGEDTVPRRLTFANRRRKVTASAVERWTETLYQAYLPDVAVEAPIFTLFRRFNNPEGQFLLSGTIRVINEASYGFFDASDDGLRTNLKWDTSDKDAIPFLRLLALLVAAEAAAGGASEMKLHYAFPTAFSGNRRRRLEMTWGQIVGQLHGVTGLKIPDPVPDTESYASAAYFLREHHGEVMSGTVFLDIGGSTIDASIWQNNEPLWQGSLRFAARDILLDTIIACPDILRPLLPNGSPSLRKLDDALKLSNRPRQYAQLDAILRRESATETWLAKLVENTEATRPAVHAISIGMAGVIYYLGLVIRHLDDYDRVDDDDKVARIPNLHIGGNGARMLHWLDYGMFRPGCMAVELFQRVLHRASNLVEPGDDRFECRISQKPKDEVAYGLISDPRLGQLRDRYPVIAGESYRYNGEIYEWDQDIEEEHLRSGIDIGRLEHLAEFIATYNAFVGPMRDSLCGEIVSSADDVARRTKEALRRFLVATRDEDVDVEPLFIIALRELLNLERGMRNGQ